MLPPLSLAKKSPVGLGPLNLRVTFSEKMNIKKMPEVKIGKNTSQSRFNIAGNWINDTQWSGSIDITKETELGKNIVFVAGASDITGNMMKRHQTFTFVIDSSAVAKKTATDITLPKLSDMEVGLPDKEDKGNFAITIQFSEKMNISINPTVRFGNKKSTLNELLNGLQINESVSISDYLYKTNAQVSSGIAHIDGTTTKKRSIDEIKAVVLQHIGAITYTYNQKLKSNPRLKGKIIIEFTIEQNGNVSRATIVSSTINSIELEVDLLNASKTFVFSPADSSGKSTTVRYPFKFSPEEFVSL